MGKFGYVDFSIGADVEVFGKLPNQETHKSLCGMIGGTKDKPRQLKHLNDGFMVQEDNVSLEYTIPVCYNQEDFIACIRTMRNECKNILNSFSFDLSENSSFSFDNEELQHPNALIFGCEPDFNAWKKIENPRPETKDKNLRTAGGHIHVGTNEVNMIEGIKWMDLFLGVPSILVDNSLSSVKRRELYGKSGAMRPKSYGFEYRVLSNFWMFEDRLVLWIYEQVKRAMNLAINEHIPAEKAKWIQKAINDNDKNLAKKLIDMYAIELPLSQEKYEQMLKIKEEEKKETFSKLKKPKSVFLEELVQNWNVTLPISFNNIPNGNPPETFFEETEETNFNTSLG